jgi:hypothetical protein
VGLPPTEHISFFFSFLVVPELNTHPAYPLSTLRCVPRDTQRKTRGRADRYSFLVRNFHPLLHAGLSRRTEMGIFRQLTSYDVSVADTVWHIPI